MLRVALIGALSAIAISHSHPAVAATAECAIVRENASVTLDFPINPSVRFSDGRQAFAKFTALPPDMLLMTVPLKEGMTMMFQFWNRNGTQDGTVQIQGRDLQVLDITDMTCKVAGL